MPAMMDDPDTPTIYRVSGAPPYPDPTKAPSLPPELVPRQVLLRDRQTAATVLPFASQHQVPPSLLRYLADQLNKEIEGGDTYPMTEPMSYEKFASYWFQSFGAVMLLGNIERPEDIASLPEAAADNMNHKNSSSDGGGGSNSNSNSNSNSTSSTEEAAGDWSKRCLGSFYIKPNYPGRSSHVCNAGFLVTDAARNRGAGRLMGESYLDWAPKLGYTYSVFNLVYETNVVSCKIWDALGFKRIGRVKGCGNLRSYPGRLVDAIIYGRDLVPGEFPEDLVSVERFDKIKYYLKYGKYPAGADRAEKSRLRSAATHYKLLENDRLMLKDKEVVPDPRRQYEIARHVHEAQHGGINKTTATIAERYHWSRIKETVSDVIRNCAECKELGKMPAPGSGNGVAAARARASAGGVGGTGGGVGGGGSTGDNTTTSGGNGCLNVAASTTAVSTTVPPHGRKRRGSSSNDIGPSHPHGVLGVPPNPAVSVPGSPPLLYNYPSPEPIPRGILPTDTLHDPSASPLARHRGLGHHNPMLQDQPSSHGLPPDHAHHHQRHHHHHHATHGPHPDSVFQPIDPQMINNPHHHPYEPYNPHPHPHSHEPSTETDFQALLTATTSESLHHDHNHDQAHSHPHPQHNHHHHHHHHHHHTPPGPPDMDAEADAAAREAEAVDRDLDMLIQQDDDEVHQDPPPHNNHHEDEDEAMTGIGDEDAAALSVSASASVPPAEQQVRHISDAEVQVETIEGSGSGTGAGAGAEGTPGDADPEREKGIRTGRATT